ncbi:MAG: DUF2085 domain-containing protein [Candidatus Thermoplasmatota archaeon]|nr:DUF2085 domain-containing protein [Candidatus Thermoplasmatota archaeon]
MVAESNGKGVNPKEFLLSHHIPSRYNRTFCLSLGHRRVRVCSRCTGQTLGGFAFLLVFVLSSFFREQLFLPIPQLLIALAPLLATVDWLTQSLGKRESSNSLRLVSGALLGFALSDAGTLLLTWRWLYFLYAVAFFLIYAAAIIVVLFARGDVSRIVAEHFPPAVRPFPPSTPVPKEK